MQTKKAPYISDRTASLIVQMAQKFYSDPENVKKYEEWHKEKYGYLPQRSAVPCP